MKDNMKLEMEAGRNIQLDHIKEMLAKNDMLRQNEKMVKMITKLREQNTRLQAQLNKEIHYNRIMKRALEKYADRSNWSEGSFMATDKGVVKADEELALQILKEIKNKE